MGPGWVISLAYLDPGNLEADLQQGAYSNLQLVWVLWWATVAGLVLQECSSRLSVVTGMNLAECSREGYPKVKSILLYIMMELAIIGSDIQEVVGSAIAINILFGLDLWIGCLITGLDTFTFLAVHQCGVRYFEALISALILCITICFMIMWSKSDTDPGLVMKGWIEPTLPRYAMMQAVGTIGAVIMPHNLYLHSGLVQSRNIDRTKMSDIADANRYNFIESGIALLLSFFVNLSVVATFAHFFYAPKCAHMSLSCLPLSTSEVEYDDGDVLCSSDTGVAGTCSEIGLDQAGVALKEAMGQAGMTVWALGLLAAGQASTMSTTIAGQIVMDGFLQIKVAPWLRVCLTRVVALGPSLCIAIGTSDNSALRNSINEWLNILQSVQLPFAIVPVLTFTAAPAVMGRFATKGVHLYICWALTALVITSNVYLVRDFYKQQTAEEEGGVPAWATLLLALYTAGYFALIGSLIVDCQKAGVRKSLSNTDLSGHVVSGIETTKYTQLPVDIKKTQLNV